MAVLTAISIPEIVAPDGGLDLSWRSAHLIAGCAAIIIAWRTRSLLATIVLGMGLFLLWRYLFTAS